jgi:hypothetical protein
MLDSVHREIVDRPGSQRPALFSYPSFFNHAEAPDAINRVNEPRKDYGGSRDKRSRAEAIFARLERLRANASDTSVRQQLERLQGIAALMQARDQGPMPGQMLRVYAWEVEDAVKIIMKNSESRSQNSE